MKVWVTKYALTQGILEREVTECGSGMVKDDLTYIPFYYYKKEYFLDKETAIARAEKMRQKKIDLLKKQIEILEKISF